MRNLFVFLTFVISLNSIAQSKKEQIEDLNRTIDSLKREYVKDTAQLGHSVKKLEKEVHVLKDKNDASQEQIKKKSQAIRDKTETIKTLNASNLELMQERKEMQKEINSLKDSIKTLKVQNKEPYISVLGDYYSLKQYTVEYAGGPVPQGPIVTLKIIKNSVGDLIAEFNYTGNVPYGCSGHSTVAKAQILSVEKLECNSFKLNLTQSFCNYKFGQNCGIPNEIDFSETNPSINDDFFITIDFKDKNQVSIESTALQSKCKYAWEFSFFSFSKTPL
ncbi:hypothetical protein N9I21_03755 [Crocinitomicaceae bacterium]|nr:hypothetical protein [Crocinitomicaceae bacterium]